MLSGNTALVYFVVGAPGRSAQPSMERISHKQCGFRRPELSQDVTPPRVVKPASQKLAAYRRIPQGCRSTRRAGSRTLVKCLLGLHSVMGGQNRKKDKAKLVGRRQKRAGVTVLRDIQDMCPAEDHGKLGLTADGKSMKVESTNLMSLPASIGTLDALQVLSLVGCTASWSSRKPSVSSAA